MQLTSRLPIDMIFFKHWHTDDAEYGFVVAKACFVRHPDGRFRAEQTRPEIRLAEEFTEGREGFQPLLFDQEISPGKPATDLIVRAIARSPGGKPRSDWEVAVTIAERLHYAFQVRGPAEWRRGLLGWKMTAPEMVQEVPITYDLAYGGSALGPEEGDEDVCEFNPAGLGFTNAHQLKQDAPFGAAQIGELGEFMAGEPQRQMQVHGLMPVAKAWLPRRGDAGTFDEEWQQTRHPRMPHDYSLRFWNCAPPPMQISPHLKGNEVLRAAGISHDEAPIEVALPGVGLAIDVAAEAGAGAERITMELTGVDADLRDPDPARHRLELIWHAMIAQPGRFETGDITGTRIEES